MLIIVVFVVGSVVLFFAFRSFSNEYSKMKHDQQYKGDVQDIITIRGVGYVIFRSGEKYSIPYSRNYNYKPHSLSQFLIKGDIIEKKKGGDSLFVFRNGKEYFFLLNKDIGEE